jgi:hypothetical protein
MSPNEAKVTRPSEAKIKKMIEEKAKERESLPQFSVFGDDNWTPIDRELKVLKRAEAGDFPNTLELARADDDVYECVAWLIDETQSDFAEGYLDGFEGQK